MSIALTTKVWKTLVYLSTPILLNERFFTREPSLKPPVSCNGIAPLHLGCKPSTLLLHQQDMSEFNIYTRKTVEAAWQMGQALADIQHHTEHGQFLDIIKSEFPHWSERSIYNFINLHKTFKFATVANLDIGLKALYMLASPSTSESTRQEIIEEAQAGKKITSQEVRTRKATGGIPKTTIEPLVADTAPVGYGKDKSLRFGRKDSVKVDSQMPAEAGGLYCLPLACDEATWRLIKRTFNDPVWTAQVLAAAASLDEREVAGLLGIQRVVEW